MTPPPTKENQLHRLDWRTASRSAAAAFIATACLTAATASAQTPAPTTPAATTPTIPGEVVSTGAPIAANGTDGIPTPGTNECYARLFKPKDVPAQYLADDTVVAQYRLRCSSDVTGYAFGFNREVVSAETEIFPTFLTSNAVIPDEAFNCSGDFPGWGVTCTGTYKGRFSTIRGLVSFQLTEEEIAAKTSWCNLAITGTATTFTSSVARDPYTSKALVNKDGTSQLRNLSAGPFRVTTPTCHGGSASASKAKKKATSKKAAKSTKAKA
ncbi:MAG: hypothetical protein Q7T55_24190 [Solirubrobacteraceae bacterium]|nr:hypothetical protein [Solirubrobacteraceae bacterium]